MTHEKQQEPLHVHSHLGEMSAWPAWLLGWPTMAKAGQRRGGLNASQSIEAGKGGDLLTRHQVNTFGLGAEMRWRGDARLRALSHPLSPVTHYKCAVSLFLFFSPCLLHTINLGLSPLSPF